MNLMGPWAGRAATARAATIYFVRRGRRRASALRTPPERVRGGLGTSRLYLIQSSVFLSTRTKDSKETFRTMMLHFDRENDPRVVARSSQPLPADTCAPRTYPEAAVPREDKTRAECLRRARGHINLSGVDLLRHGRPHRARPLLNIADKLVKVNGRERCEVVGADGRCRSLLLEIILAISCNQLCERVEHVGPLGRAEKSLADPTVSLERFTMTS
ncbi:hypothetical protein EVAR_39510_1 [Eumeta japonica]|uniref:Uncharacterized protein n=1 Tax=Eumeta variegata TaxID=151549 RepID=A0A4C1W1Y7_EUMVA|nr:hypothetical protein EVAR_39510_1 [Eumeta japonica]